jgi:hypothetical protein
MKLSTNVRTRLERAVARERLVLIVSFCLASATFLTVYLLGNFASHRGLAAPVDLLTAGSWFARALIGFAASGTVVNALSFGVSVLSDVFRRRPP